MFDKFRILVARVAKIMESWIKDTYMILCAVTAEITALDNRKKNVKKTLCISSQRTNV